jgi:ADP-ribosylglycohydrolase
LLIIYADRFINPGYLINHFQQASVLHLSYDVPTAVSALGNGSHLSSQDTVPFALWCTARHIGQFEEAMWCTVSGLGDRNTACAIVGGILAANLGTIVPKEWLASRERLDHMSREQISGSIGRIIHFGEGIE